jgi:hypothetical protein
MHRIQTVGDVQKRAQGVCRSDTGRSVYEYTTPDCRLIIVSDDSLHSIDCAAEQGFFLSRQSRRFVSLRPYLHPLASLLDIPVDTSQWKFRGSVDTLLIYSTETSYGEWYLALSRTSGRPLASELFGANGSMIQQVRFGDHGLLEPADMLPRSIVVQSFHPYATDSLYLLNALRTPAAFERSKRVISDARLAPWP